MASCWSCALQKIGGYSFLGECRYFETLKTPQPAKEIPPSVVDVGCKFWKEKGEKSERNSEGI